MHDCILKWIEWQTGKCSITDWVNECLYNGIDLDECEKRAKEEVNKLKYFM